jgi:hypothetical protein
MEKKGFRFELKEVKEDGSFEGYASVFGVADFYGDIVMAGAFAKTLDEQKQFPLLAFHDPSQPVGILEGEEDGIGLKIKGWLNLAVQRAKELHALLKQGAIKGLSIGFDAIKKEFDKEIRILKEIRLWEVSLVTFPANPMAQVTAVKNVEDILAQVMAFEAKDGLTDEQKDTVSKTIKRMEALLGKEPDAKSTPPAEPQNIDPSKPDDAIHLKEVVAELKALLNSNTGVN